MAPRTRALSPPTSPLVGDEAPGQRQARALSPSASRTRRYPWKQTHGRCAPRNTAIVARARPWLQSGYTQDRAARRPIRLTISGPSYDTWRAFRHERWRPRAHHWMQIAPRTCLGGFPPASASPTRVACMTHGGSSAFGRNSASWLGLGGSPPPPPLPARRRIRLTNPDRLHDTWRVFCLRARRCALPGVTVSLVS